MVKGNKMGLDLLTFLTIVCHQPYSEAKKIPLRVAVGMFERFGVAIQAIVGKLSDKNPVDAENIIKGLDPPEFWVKDGKRKKKEKEAELKRLTDEPKPTN